MKLARSVLLALAIGALPLASHAHPGAARAVNACVKSFVDTYLQDHPVRQVKTRLPASGPLDFVYGARNYTVALAAHGVESGKLIAQALCVANAKGVVVVLDSPASPEYLAKADFTVSLRR